VASAGPLDTEGSAPCQIQIPTTTRRSPPKLAAHPVLTDNLVRIDERYMALRHRVDEVEAKLECHDLLLARLLEIGRGITRRPRVLAPRLPPLGATGFGGVSAFVTDPSRVSA
jgi:hypothetical protein